MILLALQPSDIPSLLTIEKECFPDPWTENSWEAAFARNDFFGFVLKEKDTLIGFVCGTALFEESELLKIAVSPPLRGKGCGNQLLGALLDESKKRGAEKMFLEVREGNLPARKLYEKTGFIQTRVRKKYYDDGENAVEMFKTLDKE